MRSEMDAHPQVRFGQEPEIFRQHRNQSARNGPGI